MNRSQEQFIRSNRGKMTPRQMAKQLNLDRSAVERFLNHASDRPDSVLDKITGMPDWACVLIVAAAAFLIRALYFWKVNQTPFAVPLANTLDDGIYHQMAKAILSGGLQNYSETAAYRVPAYPYFLASVYRLFGESFQAVRWVQLMLGVGSSVLVYSISRIVTRSKLAASGSGLLYATYMTSVFFENILLGETVSIFLVLCALFCLMSPFDRLPVKGISWYLSGLLFGAAILLRPHFLFAMPVLAVTAFWMMIREKHMKFYLSAALCAVLTLGVLTPILPVTYRNYVLFQDKLLLSAQGGLNLYIGNHADAEGDKAYAPGLGSDIDTQISKAIQIAEADAGKKLKPSEVSSYWTHRTVEVIRSDFGRYLKLNIKKIRLMLNRYEIPDVLDIGFVMDFIPLLFLTKFEFGIIVCLAAAGLYAGFSSARKTEWMMVLAVLSGYAAGLTLFFVTGRYRLPMVPLFCIPAGYGIKVMYDSYTERRMKLPVPGLIFTVLILVITVLPVEKTNFAQSYNSLAVYMKNHDQYDSAEKYYRKAIELQPAYPSPYYNLALLYRKLNRNQEADEMMREYERLRKIFL